VISNHKEAVEAYEYAIEQDLYNRTEARKDLEFYVGDQWPEQVRQQRERAQRPTLTINRIGQFVRQITGEARQNPPSIKVSPVENADEEAAQLREGLIRHIEHRSSAQESYNLALDGAATCD